MKPITSFYRKVQLHIDARGCANERVRPVRGAQSASVDTFSLSLLLFSSLFVMPFSLLYSRFPVQSPSALLVNYSYLISTIYWIQLVTGAKPHREISFTLN